LFDYEFILGFISVAYELLKECIDAKIFKNRSKRKMSKYWRNTIS